MSVCTEPGCPELVEGGGRCAEHDRKARRANDARRPRGERRYGPTFEHNRKRLLASRPLCACGCGRLANTADHWPRPRAELVAAGVRDPDAIERLRPMFVDCHNRETAKQPRPERRGCAAETAMPPAAAAPRRSRVGSPGLR